MKDTRKCPECGGTDIYVNKSYASQGKIGGINLLPDVAGQIFNRLRVELYVCGDCGHYAMFVPKSALETVRREWTKYE